MRKLIGIPGWNVGETTFGVSKSYLNYINQFGKPYILGPGNTDVEPLDLLILPGGKDLSPGTYGATPSFWTGDPNVMLEWFDTIMLPKYLAAGTPILGICRGAQRLWTMAGGAMVQHNNWHKQSEHNFDQCHGLHWTSATYHKEYNKLLSKVNSRHHQTMDASDGIPDGVDVVAYADAGGNNYWAEIVEIFRYTEAKVWGIQGHPEDMMKDEFTPKLIESLLNTPVEEEA